MEFDERLKRQEGETDFEYYARIGMMKLNKEIDLEWDELADICNVGESGTHWRKKMYGVKETMEYYEDKINKLTEEYYLQVQKIRDRTDEEIEDKRLTELKSKILQLDKEKIKLKEQRNDLNSIKRTIARIEHLVECMQDYIKELNERKPLINKEVHEIMSDTDAIVLISDIHMGVECDNVLDKYNPEICRLKMNYYIDKCIEKINKEKPQQIHFLCAGDLISGLIHSTTRFSNRLNVTEQVISVGELLAESIGKLYNQCQLPIKIGILTGNHDRCVASKEEHLEDENFVAFINEFVKLRLKEYKGISFYPQNDVTLINVDIRGKKCVIVHGNMDKQRTINRLIEMNGVVYDYIFQGHWHKFGISQHNNTTIITNGSFGSEDYARNARLYDKPIQLLMFFTDEGLESIYPIDLDGYKKEEK